MMKLTDEIVKEEIWKNQGINSHSLLVKLVVQGYEYEEYGNNSYLSILDRLRRKKEVRYVESSDKYYVSKGITINIPLESFSIRTNCYKCDFMRRIEDNAEMRSNKDYAGKDTYCALDPTMVVKQSIFCLNRDQCPINRAIDKITEDK